MNTIPLPKQFDGYRVKRHLGRGSYADTYLVEDPAGKDLAVKWLQINSEVHGSERFQNEIWALERLDHPAIPRFVGVGRLEDREYIVMSFAKGQDLRAIVKRQREQFETLGQVKTLELAEIVLDALVHMHRTGICHRDVKDANVIMATESDGTVGATLIDFGMCKGGGQPADAETFWGAGSSKFSPPYKLEYPREARTSHDVFAVGVLGYLLLTNVFPWDPPNPDVGILRHLMLTVVPPKIRQLNSKVRREVSEFFWSLLELNDDRRPSAQEALAGVRAVRTGMSHLSDGSSETNPRIYYPKVIRDPIHSDIRMSAFEWNLMNTREFQRLRWLRQLGTSHLVYPGAEHTRFSHALGTMRVASDIMRQFEERTGTIFDEDERQIARAYALVHDVGHIPYGHSLEDEMGIFKRHDRNDERMDRLLCSEGSELGPLLKATPIGEAVSAYFKSEAHPEKRAWISELVEAPCGADVLDYVDRDAYHCGLDHRIDSAIYRRISIHGTHLRAELYGHHGLRLDAELALESILRERYALFVKVYAHQVKVAAGAMIGKAVWHVLKDRKKPRLDESAIEWMGDHDLLTFLKNAGRPLAKTLSEMILRRVVWEPAFRSRILRQSELDHSHYSDRIAQFNRKGYLDPVGRTKFEVQLSEKAGVQPRDVIFYCPGKAPGLQKIHQYVALGPDIKEVHGELQEPYRRICAAHLNLWTAYVFVPPGTDRGTISRVARETESLLELPNEVDLKPRQLALFM